MCARACMSVFIRICIITGYALHLPIIRAGVTRNACGRKRDLFA